MKFFQDIAKALDSDVPHEYLEKYYEEHYLKMLTMVGISAICSIVIILSCICIWYKGTHMPERAVIIVSPDYSQKRLPVYIKPLTNPSAVRDWAAKALRDMYTLNLTEYEDQIENSRKYFTPEAADLFEDRMRSGMLKDIVKNKLIVSSMVVDKPIITQTGSFLGITAWKLEAVISVLYEGAIAKPINYRYKVHMTIITMPTTKNYRGIGISQLNLTEDNDHH